MLTDWRNPFENFRDKYLSPKNVKGYQLFLLRLGFIPDESLLLFKPIVLQALDDFWEFFNIEFQKTYQTNENVSITINNWKWGGTMGIKFDSLTNSLNELIQILKAKN